MFFIVVARFNVNDETASILLRVIRIVILRERIMRGIIVVVVMMIMMLLLLLRRLMLLLLLLLVREVMVRDGVKGGQMTGVHARRRWGHPRARDHG